MAHGEKMILGVLPEQGGSIESWSRMGQGNRLINHYLEAYAKDFEQIYYFSYAKEDHLLPLRCKLVKNNLKLHRWLYAMLLPVLKRSYFKNCDALRIMQMTGEIPAIIAKLLYGIPFIATYGYSYEKFSRIEGEFIRPYLFKIRNSLALRFADKIIVTTKTLFDYVAKYVVPRKIILIPNAVDTMLFKPAPLDKIRDIIYVGRFSETKNPTLLLEAASLLDRDIKLTFVGDGPMKKMLMEQARQKGLNIEFSGVIPNEKLAVYLNTAKIFVLPSRIEGEPKVLLEAMSCGLACIGTDVEGTNDVIKDGINGLLCRQDAQDMADKINILLKDSELSGSLGKRAREFILENHDFNSTIKKEIAVLEALAEESRRERAKR